MSGQGSSSWGPCSPGGILCGWQLLGAALGGVEGQELATQQRWRPVLAPDGTQPLPRGTKMLSWGRSGQGGPEGWSERQPGL